MNIVEKVKNYVKKECKKDSNIFTMDVYHSHFVPMVKYAKQLAKKLGADKEIVEVAAWLHDIGSIEGYYENHHISGAKYAEDFLKNFNYPTNKIEKIKHCINSHRGSVRIDRNSLEAKIIASADGMSHFDNIVSLLNLALVIRKLDLEDARIFTKDKLQRFWDKMLPEARDIIKDKYKAAMLLLEK